MGESVAVAPKEKGRETKQANDLFFTCSLIDYIARKTKNRRRDVADALGKDTVRRICELADVYHSDNIDAVSDGFIEQAGITAGDFDNVGTARYAVPSHWDIGKVYKRLALGIAQTEGIDEVEALFKAYASPVSDLIDDYNGSFFYDPPQSILETYFSGLEME